MSTNGRKKAVARRVNDLVCRYIYDDGGILWDCSAVDVKLAAAIERRVQEVIDIQKVQCLTAVTDHGLSTRLILPSNAVLDGHNLRLLKKSLRPFGGLVESTIIVERNTVNYKPLLLTARLRVYEGSWGKVKKRKLEAVPHIDTVYYDPELPYMMFIGIKRPVTRRQVHGALAEIGRLLNVHVQVTEDDAAAVRVHKHLSPYA